jgi:hypothetical protein
MVGNSAIQSELAKPAIGQIELNLFAEAALRPNADPVADTSSGSTVGRPFWL